MEQFFEWIIGGVCLIMGVAMRALWDGVKDLQASDKQLTEKVAQIEILVVGEYVKKDDLSAFQEAIFKKLDRIEDKLDSKVDK